MEPLVFALDENVLIWAIAGGGPVESVAGRYTRVGDDYLNAGDLVKESLRNEHRLAMSLELWRNFSRHADAFDDREIDQEVFAAITRAVWSPDIAVFAPNPPAVPLPDNFPDDDRYLAYLAVAANAIIVTEDAGVLAAAAGGALGFEAVSIADALSRARAIE